MRTYYGLRARKLRSRHLDSCQPLLSHSEALKIVTQVAAERERNKTSPLYRAAVTVRELAERVLLYVRRAENTGVEPRHADIVNALYYESERLLGDTDAMEDAKVRTLLAKRVWRNQGRHQ